MAGIATLNVKLKVTGIGQAITYGVDNAGDIQDITLTVPAEIAKGYVVVATAQVTAIQLSTLAPQIALAKMYALYIKTITGTIYLQVDTAGTTTFAEAAAHIVVPVGTPGFIPINPAGNLGVAIDAAAVTDAFEWVLLGKA